MLPQLPAPQRDKDSSSNYRHLFVHHYTFFRRPRADHAAAATQRASRLRSNRSISAGTWTGMPMAECPDSARSRGRSAPPPGADQGLRIAVAVHFPGPFVASAPLSGCSRVAGRSMTECEHYANNHLADHPSRRYNDLGRVTPSDRRELDTQTPSAWTVAPCVALSLPHSDH